MGSIGAPEILVILVVALLVLGPERLPSAVRQVGRVIGELRRMSSGFQAELRDAMDAVPTPDFTLDPPTFDQPPPGPSNGAHVAPPPAQAQPAPPEPPQPQQPPQQ